MDRPENLRPRIWVAALGALGLIGLLLAAHAVPTAATPLRAGALIWFFGFGVYETVWRVARQHRN